MYVKLRSILESQNVFDALCNPCLVSWNTMLAAYVDESQPEETLLLYKNMQEEQVNPDARTYTSSLQACTPLAKKKVVSW